MRYACLDSIREIPLMNVLANACKNVLCTNRDRQDYVLSAQICGPLALLLGRHFPFQQIPDRYNILKD